MLEKRIDSNKILDVMQEAVVQTDLCSKYLMVGSDLGEIAAFTIIAQLTRFASHVVIQSNVFTEGLDFFLLV